LISPQVIAQGIDEDDLPSYDAKVDVWSLGVVLYEALTGLQPFLADSAADMAAVIRSRLTQTAGPQQLPAFIERLPLSNEGKDFIAACLTWDARQRPSAAELLQHPWLLSMQQQAASAATLRMNSRRRSLAAQSGYLPGSVASAAAEQQHQAHLRAPFAAVADKEWPAEQQQLTKPPQAAVAAAAPLGSARSSSVGGSSDLLVDELLAASLRAMPQAHLVGMADSLDGAGSLDPGLDRSQTTVNMEVGVHSMLRTSTQRLQPSHAVSRVHAP
jgi:serine/threonine protein kinase